MIKGYDPVGCTDRDKNRTLNQESAAKITAFIEYRAPEF